MHFGHAGPADPRATWPFLLFAYGVMATLLPWLIAVTGGLVLEDDLTPRMAVALGLFVALPSWYAAGALRPTPYHALSVGYEVLLGLYACFVIVVIVARLRFRAAPS